MLRSKDEESPVFIKWKIKESIFFKDEAQKQNVGYFYTINKFIMLDFL